MTLSANTSILPSSPHAAVPSTEVLRSNCKPLHPDQESKNPIDIHAARNKYFKQTGPPRPPGYKTPPRPSVSPDRKSVTPKPQPGPSEPVLPLQPEDTESGGQVFPEQAIAHLAELVWDAPDNIVDITALGGSSLNGHHPASYFTDNCFSFSNDRDLEYWSTGISRAQRRLVKTIELKSSWEIWVNTEILLPDNTFQVEMESLWDIDGLF
jgi:hypothetical protein